MSRWYDADAEHVEVPSVAFSDDVWRFVARRYVESSSKAEKTPEWIEQIYERYRELYKEDDPVAEYVGFVWRREDAKSLPRAEVPRVMVRVWARRNEATYAVHKHFGEEWASSLWNWDATRRPRNQRP